MTNPSADGRALPGHFASYDQLYFTIADFRGRLESFIQVATIREETQRAEIQRLREEMIQRERDHEERIRLLEQRRYVEPKSVWTAVGISVAALGVFTAIINGIINGILNSAT
jgi:hypothetical protein